MSRFRIALLFVVLAVAAVLAVTLRGSRHNHHGVLGDLERAHPARVFSARLSISETYRPCRPVAARPEETVPREACGEDDGRLDALEDLETADPGSAPDSLRASALVTMIRGDSTEQPLEAAIARLSRALRLSDRPVPILVDLSAAFVARGQRTQSPRDLLQGLDLALEALETDSLDAAARFNAALTMQMLGLDEQAALAWAAYLRADSSSDWAAEARRRRGTLTHAPTPTPPAAGTAEADVRAFATAHPQEARLYGWETVLGRWGRAQLAGKTSEAAAELQLAERLGAALEARGGDASLADAVRAIRAKEHDPAAIRMLATAHVAYSDGQKLYLEADRTLALRSFARAAAARQYSPVLADWAEIFMAGSLVYLKQPRDADSTLAGVLARVDPARYPSLEARALWMRGSIPLRTGQFAAARGPLQASNRWFRRAGESEYAAAMWVMDGESAFNLRDTVAAYRLIHRGLVSMRDKRSSNWLGNTLLVLAWAANIDHMPRAAAATQDENFAIALRTGKPADAVDALLGRARVRRAARRYREAVQDVERADSIVTTIRTDPPRTALRAMVRSSRALVTSDSTSLADLDSAIGYFVQDHRNLIWLFPSILRRAELRLERGEIPAAVADLDDATARIHALTNNLDEASMRAAIVEQARERFDQLVMLHVGADRKVEALQALERGRVSFAPGYSAAAVSTGPPAAPPGQVAVEYALIGNTLLAWTLRGRDVELWRATVERGELLRTLEHAVTALESPARAASAQPDLERLYEVLVRPIEARLGASETPLVIVADGEIAGVPFAALRDARRGRYLVEDHPLRFAATLADAARPAPPRGAAAGPALLVADPAFDPREYPDLDRLGGAQAEVDALLPLYPRRTVLSGTAATPAAVARWAPGAGVIHYAGHARFDDGRPERSALVLAGADTTGRLTAGAVNRLQLREVRLVVLAACQTLRTREGRSGGLAGFSGALLAAGAGGVVGSLWEADDRSTQPLMLAFHRAYRESGDPAAALRRAQLAMLHDTSATLRSPATWAGFRYIGR